MTTQTIHYIPAIRHIARQRVARFVRITSQRYAVGILLIAAELVDRLIAVIITLFAVPIYLCIALLPSRYVRLARTSRTGIAGTTYKEYSFQFQPSWLNSILERLLITKLPLMINILAGNLSFVGPRALTPGEFRSESGMLRIRQDVKPGLICLWWIRQRGNVDFGTELQADIEYVATYSLWTDLGILLRAIPSALYGVGKKEYLPRVNLLGVNIDNVDTEIAAARIIEMSANKQPSTVCFVNADCINIAQRDSGYLQTVNNTDLVLADGIGVKLAGRLLGREIKQNVNGTDLFPRLSEKMASRRSRIFLLGGKEGAAKGVRAWLNSHYPEVQVVGCEHGYFKKEDEANIVIQVRKSGADILLVAMGAPKQEKWIQQNIESCGVRVALGVGGLFDFFSGRIERAPLWMREIGCEWIYRLCMEPKRLWKRYVIGNAMFMIRVLYEKSKLI